MTCGPRPVQTLGEPPKQIHFEYFNFAGGRTANGTNTSATTATSRPTELP